MHQEQRELNQRLTLAIESIDQTLAQHAEFNRDVRTTLARIETLLARMLSSGENGRDASRTRWHERADERPDTSTTHEEGVQLSV